MLFIFLCVYVLKRGGGGGGGGGEVMVGLSSCFLWCQIRSLEHSMVDRLKVIEVVKS